MSPLDRMTPSPAAMQQAARELAWREGLDMGALEGIVRKVTRSAQHAMIVRLCAPASNDVGEAAE